MSGQKELLDEESEVDFENTRPDYRVHAAVG